ncbi:MAG: hypothetical protein CMJ18_03850 [Phycisphaeraceae bacterium]|nr:hypothetical protein [Phycisphaeraceae bacterium]
MTWLLELIGARDELVTGADRLQWAWSRPLYLILLVPWAAAAIYIVHRHNRSLPHVAALPRHTLSASRILLLLLGVLILAGPIGRLTESISRRPVVAIVLDVSESMSLPAGPFDPDRTAALGSATGIDQPAEEGATAPTAADVRKALSRMSRLELARASLRRAMSTSFDGIGQRFEIKGYAAALKAAPWDPASDDLQTDSDATWTQDATALGTAIERVIEDAAGRDLAGIVLLSDGRTNEGPDPLRILEAAGHPAPVWSVPTGPREPVTDVSLIDVLAPGSMTVGDTASIVCTFESHGLAGKPVTVKLLREQQTLDEVQAILRDGGRQQAALSFTPGPEDKGQTMLTIVVEGPAEEQIAENNRQVVSVDVSDERLRVLYVEGGPRWDFRFLDHAMRRDGGLEATLIVEASFAGAEDVVAASGIPTDVEGFAAFHAVVLGDVSPALLSAPIVEPLAEAVEKRGLGLIIQAGPRHMPSAFDGTNIAALLPAAVDGDGTPAPAFEPFRMSVTARGALHPAFRLYDDPSKNRALWNGMPTFLWAAAARAPRAGATVLADFDDGRRPLIVEHRRGRGRVLFVGIDSTFLWRRNVGDHLFYRFWGQAIRHVGRAREQDDRSWMQVYPRRIEPGESVAIEVYGVDEAGAALDAPRLEAKVTSSGEKRPVGLSATGQPGHYRGTWQSQGAGPVRISFTDPRGRVLSSDVHVGSMGREMRRPGVDRDALGRLADASGGALIEIEELAQVPDRLQGGPTAATLRIEDELWDNWVTVLVLVSIYCTDVGIRRLLGLA